MKGPFRIDDGEDLPVPVASEDPSENQLIEQALAHSLAEADFPSPTRFSGSFDEEEDADLQRAIRESLQTH